MKHIGCAIYGVFSYLVGLTGLVAFIFYMGSWDFLPLHINSKTADTSAIQAIGINIFILVVFGLHHSIAARSSVKEKLTQLIPDSIERSTYVLLSGVFMFVICLYWQPLAGTLWTINSTAIIWLLMAVHILGWLVMVVATFEIDHFHLMGLKQSLRVATAESTALKEGYLYRIVRHPIQTGVLMGVWSTADMSMTQFMLAACMTIYIAIGLHYEEKSLIAHFGDAYVDYKKRVPAVIPFWPMK